MKTFFRILLVSATLSIMAACSDSVLEHQIAGTWVADMNLEQPDSNSLNGTITLILDAENRADTLIIDAPGGKGLLDSYCFAGSWSASDNKLTLNLSNKMLQKHTDRINEMADSILKAHPEFEGKLTDSIPVKAEINLLEAFRKNVGCRSTMNISELTDSVLVLSDNNSSIRFNRN